MNMTHFKMLRWDRACFLWAGQVVTLASFLFAGLYYAHVHVPLAHRNTTELLVLGFLFFGSAIPALVTAASSASLLQHQIKQIKTFALIVGIGLATVGYLVTFVCVSLFVSGSPGLRLLIRVVAIPLIMEAQLGLVRVLARRHFQPDLNLDRALLFMSPTIVTAGIVGQLLSTSFETLGETIGAALLLGAVEMVMRLTTLQRDQLYMRMCGTRCSTLCGRGDAEGDGEGGEKQRSGASAPGEWRLFASYILLDSASQDVGIVLSLAVNLMFRPPVTPGGVSLSSGEVLLRVSIQYLLELVTEMSMPVALWCAVRVGGMRQWHVGQQQVLRWGQRRSQRKLAPPAQSPAARYRPLPGPLAVTAEQGRKSCESSCSHLMHRLSASCSGGSSSPERDAYFWSCGSLCPRVDDVAVRQTAAELWVEQRPDRDALRDAVWLQPALGVLSAMSAQGGLGDVEGGALPVRPLQSDTASPIRQASLEKLQIGDDSDGASPTAGSPYRAVRRHSSTSSGSTASLRAPTPLNGTLADGDSTCDSAQLDDCAPQAQHAVPLRPTTNQRDSSLEQLASSDIVAAAEAREATGYSFAPDPDLVRASLRPTDGTTHSGRPSEAELDGGSSVHIMPGKLAAARVGLGGSSSSRRSSGQALQQAREAGGSLQEPKAGKLHPAAHELLDDTPAAAVAAAGKSAPALPEPLAPPRVAAMIDGSRSPHGPHVAVAAASEAPLVPLPVTHAQALLVQLEMASVRLIRGWDTRFPFYDVTFVVTAFSMTTWLLMSVLFTKQCPYGDAAEPSSWRFDVCQDFV